jgi:hypothetical protein
MESKVTTKACITLVLMCCLFVMMPAAAFSWNQATHAYIADRLGARAGYDNLDEMWGSTAPDFFNYIFDPDLCPGWVSDETHGMHADTFLNVWNAAVSDTEHALAYGFVTHNEPWGADHTAHEACLTCGQGEGYIIVKAKQLLGTPMNPANPLPTFGDTFAGLGMSPDEALLVAHVSTEYAVDIMLRNDADPLLGRKVAKAARSETKGFRSLLVKAYAADYAAHCFGGDYSIAASELTAAEKGHRKDMIFLGRSISQPETVAVRLLAEQLAAVLPDFLGRPLPVPEAEAVETMKAAIVTAMSICDDYKAEIDATIGFVEQKLKDHGITYNPKSDGRKTGRGGL